jgi:hypothetical protein
VKLRYPLSVFVLVYISALVLAFSHIVVANVFAAFDSLFGIYVVGVAFDKFVRLYPHLRIRLSRYSLLAGVVMLLMFIVHLCGVFASGDTQGVLTFGPVIVLLVALSVLLGELKQYAETDKTPNQNRRV